MTQFPLITITQAARLKRCTAKTLWEHAKKGSFDTVRIAGRTLIVDNAKWRSWEPNRERQRAIFRGLRKARRRALG